MKRCCLIVLLALFATLIPGSARAQDGELDRFAFGVGIGLVDLSDSLDDDGTETYLQANFRVLLGDKQAGRDEKTVVAYLEAELGYWNANYRIPIDDNASSPFISGDQTDLMLGLNIVAVVPFERVDYFIGAGLAIHNFDSDASLSTFAIDDDETFGVNIQTGIDVRLSETIGIYGLLRLDLVEDVVEEQAKILLGLRFFFG